MICFVYLKQGLATTGDMDWAVYQVIFLQQKLPANIYYSAFDI